MGKPISFKAKNMSQQLTSFFKTDYKDEEEEA